MVWITYKLRQENYEKKTGENGNEERRKGSSFSRWDPTLSKFTAGFYLRFTKKSQEKRNQTFQTTKQ